MTVKIPTLTRPQREYRTDQPDGTVKVERSDGFIENHPYTSYTLYDVDGNCKGSWYCPYALKDL